MIVRSKKITDSARGEDCTLRLIGICNNNPETVIFAHVGRRRGMAIKCGDHFGVYACSSCHDAIDGRDRLPDSVAEELPDDILRALEETQEKLFDKGLLIAK